MQKPLSQRIREITAIPEQVQEATEQISALVFVFGMIALAALALSIVALGRTSHGH